VSDSAEGTAIKYFSTMEIAEVKQRLTLSEVLRHYGLKPDKNLRLLCPFHDDKKPSLPLAQECS
jgi:DNA primase